MCRCVDVKMWRCVDVVELWWRCVDVKMDRCVDVV